MKIFKNKWFNNWTRKEKISDDTLIEATNEIETGKVERLTLEAFFLKRDCLSLALAKAGDTESSLLTKKATELFFCTLLLKIRDQIFLKEKRLLGNWFLKVFCGGLP